MWTTGREPSCIMMRQMRSGDGGSCGVSGQSVAQNHEAVANCNIPAAARGGCRRFAFCTIRPATNDGELSRWVQQSRNLPVKAKCVERCERDGCVGIQAHRLRTPHWACGYSPSSACSTSSSAERVSHSFRSWFWSNAFLCSSWLICCNAAASRSSSNRREISASRFSRRLS